MTSEDLLLFKMSYPVRGNRMAWGVNSTETGFNIVRPSVSEVETKETGIRRPDGNDEGLM